MTNRFAKKNESGRSMVEMLGVLAIVGVLSAGGLLGYSQAMKKHKLNQTQEQIQQIITNIRTAFPNAKQPKITSLEQAVQLGIFPESMVQSTTEIVNKYNGSVSLDIVTINGKKVYKLSFKGLPKDIAASLLMNNWSDEQNLVKIGVNEGETE